MWNDALTDAVMRWGHVISGITWIGLLYFFNFVNVPFQGKLDGDTKKKVNPELLPRALWWFRWAAVSTLLFGLLLFWWIYLDHGDAGHGGQLMDATGEHLTGRARFIMWGMTLAVIMFFNVWFVIWPAQRKIINGVKTGNPAPAHLGKRALLASRANTFLSGPMLLMMILAGHATAFSYGVLGIVVLIGLIPPFLAIKSSAKVGQSV
jgi:uncharacterized membrane protein